jgi:GntR family transcriptional regulator
MRPAFYESLLAQGLDPITRLLDYRLVTLDAGERALLDDESGMLLVRQYVLEDRPFALTRAYLPREAADVAWSLAEANPVIRLIETHLGAAIARTELMVRAAAAGADAALLGTEPEAPILVMERRSWSASGRPLEITRCMLRADAFEFALPVAGPVSIADGFRRPEVRA